MSIRLLRGEHDFAFAFRCNAGCKRPEVVALTIPAGWETLITKQGERLHRCPGCRFDLIVEPLIRDLGWRREAA